MSKPPYVPSFTGKRSDGKPADPIGSIVPVLKHVGANRYKIVGTGFYITHYGLFATAKHVIEDLLEPGSPSTLGPSYVPHIVPDQARGFFRKVTGAYVVQDEHNVDVAIGQAGYGSRSPLVDLPVRLSDENPGVGAAVKTFAYPENEILDFGTQEVHSSICYDYYHGIVTEVVEAGPYIPYPHFRTSVEIKSGASGGPIFGPRGSVVGINCRGFDFKGGEWDGSPLSSIVPAFYLLRLRNLPPPPLGTIGSGYLPPDKRYGNLSGVDLARYTIIGFDPPLDKIALDAVEREWHGK